MVPKIDGIYKLISATHQISKFAEHYIYLYISAASDRPAYINSEYAADDIR